MSLQSQITSLATRIAHEIKSVRTEITSGTVPRVYVQPTAPTVQANTPYIWIQTGLGPQGQDTTMWFEDGASA